MTRSADQFVPQGPSGVLGYIARNNAARPTTPAEKQPASKRRIDRDAIRMDPNNALGQRQQAEGSKSPLTRGQHTLPTATDTSPQSIQNDGGWSTDVSHLSDTESQTSRQLPAQETHGNLIGAAPSTEGHNTEVTGDLQPRLARQHVRGVQGGQHLNDASDTRTLLALGPFAEPSTNFTANKANASRVRGLNMPHNGLTQTLPFTFDNVTQIQDMINSAAATRAPSNANSLAPQPARGERRTMLFPPGPSVFAAPAARQAVQERQHQGHSPVNQAAVIDPRDFDGPMHSATEARDLTAANGVIAPPVQLKAASSTLGTSTSSESIPLLSTSNIQLDYSPEALLTMSFSDIQTQSMDIDPRGPPPKSISSDNLLQAHLKSLLDAHDSDAQRIFLDSLPIDQWEAAGQWLVQQQGLITQKMVNLRRQKRDLAVALEGVVGQRYAEVRDRREVIIRCQADMRGRQWEIFPKAAPGEGEGKGDGGATGA